MYKGYLLFQHIVYLNRNNRFNVTMIDNLTMNKNKKMIKNLTWNNN